MEEIKTIEQIELMPGFEIIEFTPAYSIIKVPSEFTLKIKRLPPFIYESIEEEDIKDLGPFKITVKLLQINMPEAHLEQEIIYEPPTDENDQIVEPDRETNEAGWVYYKEWEAHEQERAERIVLRGRRRWDFTMLNCIEIVDGPIEMEDDGWLEPLLSMISLPESFGDRKLLFLKTQVIYPTEAREVIGFFVRVQEVTMEGLKKAFDSFRSAIRRPDYFRGNGQSAGG